MKKSLSEFELFEIETRIRNVVAGMLEPVMKKAEENEVALKNLLGISKRTEESMNNFEELLSKSIVKMVTNEEFNKRMMEMFSDKRSTDTVFHMKIESIGSRVDFMNHQFSDMNSRTRNLEEIEKHVRIGFDSLSEAFREFKEEYSIKLERIELSLLGSGESHSDNSEKFTEDLKLHRSILTEINQKAIPDILSKLEFHSKDLKELEFQIEFLRSERVVPGDLKKLKNQLDHEIKKTRTHNDQEVRNLREFLDKMLRIEISCGVSDTLLQVLDPRQIKKLIPVTEAQLKQAETDPNDPKDEQTEINRVTTELLRKKTMDQNKMIEEKITIAKRRLTKEFESPIKMQSIKKLEFSQMEPQSKSPLASGGSTTKRADPKPDPPITEESKSNFKDIESPLIEYEKPEKKKHRETVVSSLISDKSAESFVNVSEISLDPIWVQEQISQLNAEMKISQQTREEVLKLMSVCVEAMKLKVNEAQQTFSKTVQILNEEVNQLGKQRQKDLSDIYSYIDSNLSDITEKIVKLDNNDSKLVKMNEVLLGVIENEKIIFELIAQDEDDRKNIQLMGYSEGKPNKNLKSKTVVSLKPECLSCTGENPLVYSVFKMACLNYNPSDVNYNSNVYPRKVLIEKLGEMIGNVWSSDSGDRNRPFIVNDYSSVRIKSHQRTRTTSKNFLDFTLTKLLSEHVTPQHSRREFKHIVINKQQ